MNVSSKKDTTKLQCQCAQCGDVRPPTEFVTRKVFFRRRKKLVGEEMRFCKDKMCGSAYQAALDASDVRPI